ncbi:PRC-barrel domain-containing protein [Nocardia paucivorans]|uniref:PRC-barrel domain-containing protein n=1 Tax=Nocardia paucivorans TaxID=114259 RepID=UPI000303472C|nr:PRC-barrel domain-containing protein [Nocardia paucivorans]
MSQRTEQIIGDTVYDPNGDKIGKVKRVYVDNMSGELTWAAVSTGLFGTDSLVPLSGAGMREDKAGGLQVQVPKEAVKSAPRMEGDGLITPEAEDELLIHYGMDPRHTGRDDYNPTAGQTGTAAQNRGLGQEERADRPRPGEYIDPASGPRSEEQLDIGTEREEWRR